MPLYERAKKVLKQAEDDLKRTREDIKKRFKSIGLTTPEATSSEAQLTITPSHAQEQGGSHDAGLLGIQSTRTTERLNLQVVSQSQAVEQLTSSQTPNESLGESSTRKDLKQLATEAAGQIIDTLKIGPLKDVSNMLQSFVDMYKLEGTVESEYKALQHQLKDLIKTVDDHANKDITPAVSARIKDIRDIIKGELNSIGRGPRGKQHGRLVMAKEDEERLLGYLRRIQGYINRLSLDTTLSVWKLENEQSKDRMSSWVRLLPSSTSAWYNSNVGADLKRRECTPGTRVDVLANLLAWTNSSNMDSVYWLNGMAGTGKTTIAYSVCKELSDKHRLAASFFCSRLREECRDVNRIIPSIAYQLAQFSPPFQLALSAVLEKDQDAHHKVLTEQFGALIRRPLLAVLAIRPPILDNMIVVIDALDECDNKESTRSILEVLLGRVVDLPIKFIVSSRPEAQIRDQMSDGRVKAKLVLHELDTGDVQADIETYIRDEFKLMKPPPAELQIAALVEKAGILFIYAATAVRYIGYDNFRRNPDARLRTVLDGQRTQRTKMNEGIDDLYATILKAALDDQGLEEHEQDEVQQVLYTVICAREPLTVAGISELLEIHNVEQVRAALRPLWSVLQVVGTTEVVTTLHASFPDFMFDPVRSNAYHCDHISHNRKFAKHCLARIKRAQPQFNICELESSYLPDEMVPNIKERVAIAISSDLSYACRHWADHIEAGRCSSTLIPQLRDFLSTRLLLWMEVLNLDKRMDVGTECMKLMVGWCNHTEAEQDLIELAYDARRFVDTFASNLVSQSTPHIYVSMLAFWPRTAPIAKHYAYLTHGPVEVEGAALDQRQLARLATWVFDKSINAIAVSQNGRHIALVVGGDALVIDLSGGQIILGPLHGHSDNVHAIRFSSDQTRLLSSSLSLDAKIVTIIGWDSRTGNIVLGPFKLGGHAGWFTSLSFSADCARIITSSSEEGVCVWDAENGNLLRCLEICGPIMSIALSLDGTQIAATFYAPQADCGTSVLLQLWNLHSGETTLGPLSTKAIAKIAFSPDNSYIACFEHETAAIYVLDAQKGDIINQLHHEHRGEIRSIGYSPDGRSIASISGHQTVELWDARTGETVLGPLEGHTGWITSCAFSIDSSYIISGCSGGLVCIWDARQRNVTPHSTSAHPSDIFSVNLSSDGKRFVSGTKDGSLCVWDVSTGEIVVNPINAHTHAVRAVDFLNDRIASGADDGTMCLYDAQNGEIVLGPIVVAPGGSIQAISYSPDRSLIATGSSSKGEKCEVNLWDARTGVKVLGPLLEFERYITSVRFSPDSTHIISSSLSEVKHVVVWDVSTGANVFGYLNGHTHYVNSVAYSPNGALFASGSSDKTIIIWDAYTGTKKLGPLTGHTGAVSLVCFSPESSHLVSGSHDGTIRIWDVRTGEMDFKLPHGHEQAIGSVAYSPDGARILSLCYGGGVRIHDARGSEERALPNSNSLSEYGDWTMNKDGWIVDDQSRLLVWVPGDLRRALVWPRAQVMVAPWGYVRLKFDKSRMGESWEKSFIC